MTDITNGRPNTSAAIFLVTENNNNNTHAIHFLPTLAAEYRTSFPDTRIVYLNFSRVKNSRYLYYIVVLYLVCVCVCFFAETFNYFKWTRMKCVSTVHVTRSIFTGRVFLTPKIWRSVVLIAAQEGPCTQKLSAFPVDVFSAINALKVLFTLFVFRGIVLFY